MSDGPISASGSVNNRRIAAAGFISLIGSAFSALMGFVLTIVVARSLGEQGAGVVLQVIGIIMISLSLARLGMDTASVWYLPRLVESAPHRIRGALVMALGTAGLVAVVTTVVVRMAASVIAPDDEVRVALVHTIWLVPAASMFLVALACTRGLGGIGPYIAIGSLTVPALRPLLILIAVACGGTATAASVAWAAPFLIGLLAALIVLTFQVRRHERSGTPGIIRPDVTTRHEMFKFAAPRTAATAMEQSIVWLDVILVGAIAGTAAAGVYGSASRFLAAGLLIDTAMRTVVSPVFSSLMWRDAYDELHELFTQTTRWLVLFSTPLNVAMFVFAPFLLGLLGSGFEEGATAMRILAAGMVITLFAGNIHSVLLMSGRSGWAAFNKAVVLVMNVVGNIIFIPLGGIEAAAIVWTVSMMVDAVLATIEVRAFTGVLASPLSALRAFSGGLVTVALPAALIAWALGQDALGFFVAALMSVLSFGSWVVLDRRALQLAGLVRFRRRKESS